MSFAHRLNAMCDPKGMQMNMLDVYRNPEFNKFLGSMDDKEVKSMLEKPGADIKKAFDTFRKEQLEMAKPEAEKKQDIKPEVKEQPKNEVKAHSGMKL